MTYYFIGGEDHDFTKIGACSVDTASTSMRRTGNARCSLKVGGSSGATDGWQGTLNASVSSLWATARMYKASTGNNNYELFALLDGTTRRIVVRMNSSAKYEICKRNAAGTTTLLAASSASSSSGIIEKLDVHVVYGVSGSIDLYIDGTLLVSYTGDITTDSATSLNGFVLGNANSGASPAVYWSEVIVSSGDTRGESLVTMAPAANGNSFAWTNSYANVDEVTLDDADLCTSSTANDLAQATITALTGISSGNPAIRAVCVSARAQKGGSGPQNAQLNVRTGGNDYFGSTVALPVAFNRVATIFETNPATSGTWAYTDLTAAGFNIGIKSIT